MKNEIEKKNCLLIVHDVYQEYNIFPLGIGYLSAMLEKHNYSVEVYCMDVFHYTNEQLAEKLQNSEYDIIGMGFMAPRYKQTVVGVSKVVNEHKKNAWYVLGGYGPSPIAEYIIKDSGCDIVGIGEGDYTIVELMEQKLSPTPDLSLVEGIAYRDGDTVKETPRRPKIKDLDAIPFPAWHLFPMDKYVKSARRKGVDKDENLMSILTSRGCTDTCSFCYRLEEGIRFRSMENVMEEITLLENTYGVEVIKIEDELFAFTKKRVRDWQKALNKNNKSFKYMASARVDVMEEELLQILKDTGCIFLNVGFESSSQKVLDYMNKRASVEQNIQTLETCKKIGLVPGMNFICNFEPETKEDIINNAKLIMKYTNHAQLRTIRPATPYPGAPMYFDALQKGLLSGPEEFFDKFVNSDLVHTNFTKYTTEEFHEILLEANSMLIIDYFENTNGDMESAEELINEFKLLYRGQNNSFRGSKIALKEKIKRPHYV